MKLLTFHLSIFATPLLLYEISRTPESGELKQSRKFKLNLSPINHLVEPAHAGFKPVWQGISCRQTPVCVKRRTGPNANINK